MKVPAEINKRSFPETITPDMSLCFPPPNKVQPRQDTEPTTTTTTTTTKWNENDNNIVSAIKPVKF